MNYSSRPAVFMMPAPPFPKLGSHLIRLIKSLHIISRLYSEKVYILFCSVIIFLKQGGNCETIMIANIWGEAGQIEETISTLRFATRMMCISINPGVNEYYDPALLVKKLEKEIKHLKHELGMHDTLVRLFPYSLYYKKTFYS